jgi:TonB family protein
MPPTIQMKPGQPPPFSGAKTVTPAKTMTPVEATVLMKGAPPPTPPPIPTRAKAKPAAAPPPPPPLPSAEEETPATVVLAQSETLRAQAPEVTLRAPSTPTVKQPAPAVPAPPAASDPGGATTPAPAAPLGGPRKRPTTLLVAGGLALLLLLGLGLGALAIVKRREPAAATPAPLPPPTTLAAAADPTPGPSSAPAILGALRVESQPPGATVTVDNQPRGVTPLDIADLALGPHSVKVELRGYTPATQSVDLSAEAPRAEMKLSLARVAPAAGVADILSTPFGATVKIDGAVVGRTPLLDFKLKPGPHQVEIAKDGYETWSQSVTAGGKKVFVDGNLRPLARATPAPSAAPESVDASKVYAENEVDTQPKKLSGMSASYPVGRAPRLRPGDSVSVTVSYIVNEAGQITELKATESGGKILDDEVLSALKDWKYAPGAKRGTKVKVRLVRKFTFKGG